MDKYIKLINSLRCNGDGIAEEADGLGCANKKCKYRDVDGACDLTSMALDAAAALDDLTACLTALQAENAEKDREIERLQAALSRVEEERDEYKRALRLSIETHSVEPRQIERLERYYLEQARGAPGEG